MLQILKNTIHFSVWPFSIKNALSPSYSTYFKNRYVMNIYEETLGKMSVFFGTFSQNIIYPFIVKIKKISAKVSRLE